MNGDTAATTLRGIGIWNTGETVDLRLPAGAGAPEGDVDASGMTLAPGLADPHVHFRDPGQTDKETMVTGCRAAASGGYTRVLVMPNTVPAMDGEPVTDRTAPGAAEVLDAGCTDVIDYLQHYGKVHGLRLPVRYDLCVSASKGRAGLEASDPRRWGRFTPSAGSEGKDPDQLAHRVTALSDDGAAVPAAILDRVLANARETGLYLIEHCEHHDTGAVNEGPVSRALGVPGIPEETELAIVSRDIEAARRTGTHIHFQHVSTAVSFEAIRRAKAEGLPITCETAPHYLALNDTALLERGTMAKMNPPLRSEEDRQATIAAVADGTVDLLATDHAPHTEAEKALGFLDAPNGIIGLECAYAVCRTVLVGGGHIDDCRLIELMAVAPARLMGYEPTDVAGLVDGHAVTGPDGRRLLDLTDMPGREDADLSVLAPDRAWTIDPARFASKARNTPFAGWKVTGMPMATILGGRFSSSRL